MDMARIPQERNVEVLLLQDKVCFWDYQHDTRASIARKSDRESTGGDKRKGGILRNCNRILKNISQLLIKHSDESKSLQEDCHNFRDSTEADFNSPTEFVNDDVASNMLRRVGKSVLKARCAFLGHFEDAVNRVRIRENSENTRNIRIQEAFERKKIQCKELDAQNRLLLQEKIGLEKRLSGVLAELHSERDDYGLTPSPPPPETTPSPTQEPSPELSLTAQLAQAEAVQLNEYLKPQLFEYRNRWF